MSQERKPGVYLCGGCGIAEAISLDGLEKVATAEFKAPLCKRHDFLCGEAGVKMIADDVVAGTVNQVVIAACSPRVMADRFDFAGAQVVRANIREQVAWAHAAGDEDTQAVGNDNLRMALTQASKIAPPAPWVEGEFSKRVLVVGGGVAGLTAAREGAKAGYPVLLVERSDMLGGMARKLSKRMPHLPPYRDPQPNDIEDLIKAVEGDSRITVMTDTVVAKTSGMPGKFAVELAKGGTTTTETVGAIVVATGFRPYDPTKLGHLGYGTSPDVVTNFEMETLLAAGPVKRKSDGTAPKAVAFVQCAGSRDPAHLPYCSSFCCGASIKQAMQLIEQDPGTMCYIVYEELRTPGVAEEFYRAAQAKGVVFMKGKVKSVDGSLTVVYDDLLLGEEVPLGPLDMVVLATGMVPNSTDPSRPTVPINDEQAKLARGDINPVAPIPVAGYAGGAAPEVSARSEEGLPEGAPILNLQYRQGPHIPILADGFSDSHYICFPYETRRTGIYTCGPVRRPMDMAETAEDATGAMLKAIQAIRMVADGRAVHPRSGDLSFPKIGYNACTKCRRCTVECPFGAIDENEQDFPVVNPTRCRRCGTCMGACPVRTISFDNYSVEMLTSMIKAVEVPDEFSGKPRILIMACENDAYPAIDMVGLKRQTYSAHVRIIPVRCLGSVSLLCVSDALSKGYDGVVMMGCKSGDDYQCHFVKGSAMAQERMSKVGETLKSMMLEPERVTTLEVAISDSHKLAKVIDDFVATIQGIGLNPFKGF
jgi:quinone-modifying oxidoreductase subunit QmoB